MRIYFEIFNFSDSQAHGNIVVENDLLETEDILIPFSMPMLSFETALRARLIQEEPVAQGLVGESTMFFSPSELKPKKLK